MAKYLIPFYSNSLWESNKNCKFCESIDTLYKEVRVADEDKKEKILNFLDEDFLVNGYNLLFVYEKAGYHVTSKNKIEALKSYKTNTEAFMNEFYRLYDKEKYNKSVKGDPFYPVLIHSRWCKNCGSRKPNIYDSNYEY